MGNDDDLSNALIESIRARLPSNWKAQIQQVPPHQGPDAWLSIVPPAGAPYRFAVELKSRLDPRDVDFALHLMSKWNVREPLMVAAPHLSPRTRALLKELGISFADTFGNMRLCDGALFVEHTAPGGPPRRADERVPRTSLRGPLTGRVVRYLCEAFPPRKVRQIAADISAPPGNVSRILDLLERERLIKREPHGPVVAVAWEEIVKQWAPDLQRNRKVQNFLEPRDLNILLERLATTKQRYSLTGSFAAAQIAPAALPAAVDVYVDDPAAFAKAFNLHASSGIGNVRLVAAYDNVVFDRTLHRNGLVLANPFQIAADLLTLPKRSDEEYQTLLAWMKAHEQLWRVA